MTDRSGDKRSAWFERELDAAVAAHRRGDLKQAIAGYERLLARKPDDVRALTNLAAALRRAGRREDALVRLRRAVAIRETPESWFNCGNLLADLERPAEAEQAYRRALELDPKLYRAATNIANLLASLQRTDEAIEFHRRAIAAAPDNLPSMRALARLLYERGDWRAAEDLYRQAHALAPRHADTLNAWGVVLKDLGRRDEAIRCWLKVLEIQPRHAVALNNLGVLYRMMHKPEPALKYLRAAIKLDPLDATTAANLAYALLDVGQTTEAEKLTRAIVERQPDNADGHLMLGFALTYQGEVDAAIESFLVSHRLAPQSAMPISNALFASLYSDRYDGAGILGLHRELAVKIAPATRAQTHHPSARKARAALRIGYLSPDLRSHPVSVFFEPILEHHDRDRVETFCYSTTNAPDQVTQRLQKRAGTWRDCNGWSDARIAAQIESDAIDILVELAGHTAQNGAAVLRSRPAPVQALYIGYPGTSGLPEVDYLIADARVCPPSCEKYYSERIARVDGSFWCYRPPERAPAAGEPPLLRNGHVTFGSYNALHKVSKTTFELWARLLRAVPQSRLVLKSLAFADEALRASVRRKWEDAGIDARRVDTEPPTDPAAFLAEYRRIDIGLDPTPYNGGTTTCEALWMGVPVITLAGDRFSARMGASLLPNVGLPQMVAQSADDYVRIAAELAADPSQLRTLRRSLRDRMAASPICDAPRVARELEQAFQMMCE